ncbi:MAG: acyltransferase family protein [Lysobacteraceae bacterium]
MEQPAQDHSREAASTPPAAAAPPAGSWLDAAPPASSAGRIEAIDLARGFAVCLMILSHGVNGLLSFDQFTDWGMVPVHAVTKFSSSLFVLVFGIAMAVAFVPKALTPEWPRYRLKLLLTGVVVLFWYKVLTVVEMNHLYEPADIVDALLYRDFPSYVEILGFYAIALLWIPFFLPIWARLPAWARWSSPVALGLVSWALLVHFDFWGMPTLQALLVEHPDYYTWGQLARGPLILAGLVIGGLVLAWYADPVRRRQLAAALAGAGVLSLAVYFLLARHDVSGELLAVAHNAGKHPPELAFMLFSVGGALLLLGLSLLGGERLALWLRPVTVVGSNALQAFIFHIVVIFVVFRLLLGWFHTVSYEFALGWAIALVFMTAAWIRGIAWIEVRRRS